MRKILYPRFKNVASDVFIVDNARATANGEVSEWPMVQSWKDCVGAIPPGVRIPSSPVLSQITGDQWNKINQKSPLHGRFWHVKINVNCLNV